MISDFLLTVYQSVNIVIFGFGELIDAFPFFPRKNGSGVLTSGLA